MPRAQALDPLHNFRFHAVADVDGTDVLAYSDDDGAQAGFQSCSTPEQTVEVAEYREGIDKYVRKYPGQATWNDVSMTRGVMKNDTTFADWVQRAVDGEEYRADVVVYHWHRDGHTPGTTRDGGSARLYTLFEAFAMRSKFGGDLDSQASDISLAELDVAYEYAEITNAT
jgi:phage tail-like protein